MMYLKNMRFKYKKLNKYQVLLEIAGINLLKREDDPFLWEIPIVLAQQLTGIYNFKEASKALLNRIQILDSR